jgi:hypothetical protein
MSRAPLVFFWLRLSQQASCHPHAYVGVTLQRAPAECYPAHDVAP